MPLLYIFDLIGVFVFAISGAIAGRQKNMDIFGMFILALVTCVGGGTLRSLLIGATPPPALVDPAYLTMTAVAVMVSFFAEPIWEKWKRVVSLFDALGLGVFVCIGIQVSQANDLSWWACIAMGVVTASFGGVLRDLLRAEIPLIFRQEIYATAALAGGLVYLAMDRLEVPVMVTCFCTTLLTSLIRIVAIRYDINLPGCQNRKSSIG